MRFSALILTIALIVPPDITAAQSISDRAERDETIQMSREVPEMREAFTKAKASLDDFLQKARTPASGTSGYALKVAISDDRYIEYFWVSDFTHEGDSFTGILNNEARHVMKHKLGEKITFQKEQIADWMFIDDTNQRTFGNFTACALLTKESPAEAEAFKRQYGLQCE